MTNAEWLASEWNTRFADVMQTMAEAKPEIQFTAIDNLPQGEQPQGSLVWWKQPFSCAPRGFLSVGAPEQTCSALGQSVLTAAGLDGSPPAETRKAWLDVVRKSMDGVAEGISRRISVEVTCGEGLESANVHSDKGAFKARIELPGSTDFAFYIVVSEVLAESLSKPAQGNGKKDLKSGPYDHLANVAGSRTFELLLDVEMPISVSFGRATLRIGDALNLVSGSLIELDRALTDPVELLVNNCVIARGEVVVVNGTNVTVLPGAIYYPCGLIANSMFSGGFLYFAEGNF